ncbi:MAG TPA: ElyC/SanA/YdcF family protein, partial [Aggregatilineaceae bacterium]|nr:ElyC/SanA/YdcF family protein [Aggregatilineaceae bacterium]
MNRPGNTITGLPPSLRVWLSHLFRTRPRRFLALGSVVLGVLFITRDLWIPGMYDYLDLEQVPVKADCIVILGGEDGRAWRAIELYRAGYASEILASDQDEGLQNYLLILAHAGIPSSQILANAHPTSTWDEAQQVLAILKDRG